MKDNENKVPTRTIMMVTEEAGPTGEIKVEYGDNAEDACLAMAMWVTRHLRSGDKDPINWLLGVVSLTLGMESSGQLEREFIRYLKKLVPQQREGFRRAAEAMREQRGKPKS